MEFVKLVELDLSTFGSDKPIDYVLFLDFDGVLHREMSAHDEWMNSLPILERALQETDPQQDIAIVISSDWKYDHDLQALRGFLGCDVGRRVIGVTPDRLLVQGQEVPSAPRQAEIACWLQSHAPGAQWLAIDDRHQYFEPQCARLLLTNGRKGLVPMDEERMTLAFTELLRNKAAHTPRP